MIYIPAFCLSQLMCKMPFSLAGGPYTVKQHIVMPQGKGPHVPWGVLPACTRSHPRLLSLMSEAEDLSFPLACPEKLYSWLKSCVRPAASNAPHRSSDKMRWENCQLLLAAADALWEWNLLFFPSYLLFTKKVSACLLIMTTVTSIYKIHLYYPVKLTHSFPHPGNLTPHLLQIIYIC